MTPEDFVASFETVAEAPGGIKKLREMILDLAMRGQIVARDPNDEPASRLLSRLRAAPVKGRVQQVATTAIVPPYEVDDSWEWCHFTDVVSIEARLVDPAGYLGSPHVAPDNIEKGTGRLLPYNTIGEDGVTSSKQRFFPGQILYSKIRPNLSKVVIVDFEGLCSADMYPLAPKIDTRFLHLFMLSPEFLKQVVREDNRLAMPKVNQQQLSETVVAVPPLAEQKRIVAKVDQLMALCDDLEARQAKKRETAVRLNRAALDALTSAEGPEDIAASFRRIAENFETLVYGPDSVEELRKVILELAIRSRIVQRLQDDDIVDNSVVGAPFPVPRSWRWVPLGDLCERITKGSSPNWQGIQYTSQSDDSILFVTSENVGRGRMLLEKPKYVERRFNDIEPRSILRVGDLLMNIVGASIGRVAIFDRDDDANINQAVCLIRLAGVGEALESEYLLRFLNSPTCVGYMFDRQVDSARANLSMGNIARFWVPVPPLAEQKRIVAKVDQLMALCDSLEAALRRAESTAQKLAEAVVAEIVA